jgi:hypothetical protein
MIKKLALKIAESINKNITLYKKRSDLLDDINKYPISAKMLANAIYYTTKIKNATLAKKQDIKETRIKDSIGCLNTEITEHFANRYDFSLPSLTKMSEDPLVDKIVRMPPSDALAAGYKINWGEDVTDEAKAAIEGCLLSYNVDDVIKSAIENERVYGAGFILPIFNALDDDGVRDKNKENIYYNNKYNKYGINEERNFCGFRAVPTEELSYLNVDYNDIFNFKYQEPETFSYNGVSIHESHFIKLKSRKKHGQNSGYDFFLGQSIVAQVVREIYNWERSSELSIELLRTKRDKVLSVSHENMLQMGCSTIEDGESFLAQEGKSYIDQLRSMSNDTTTVIQNGDALNVLQTTLSDVPNLNEYLMRNIAVVTQIPITKLFGASPAGLSSTGESDTKNYSQYLKSIQKNLIEPSIKEMIKIVADMLDIDCYHCNIEFNPIDALTQSEVTDNLTKQADAMVKLISGGVLTESEARNYLNETQGNGIVGLKIIEQEDDEEEDENEINEAM